MTKSSTAQNRVSYTPRAALYMRVSTGAQAAKDLSVPDQLRQLTEFCASKGWTIAADYSDARTGRDDNRPGFQKMMDAARADNSPFDVIVVHSFSRFFRDQVELELRARELAKRGIKLVSMTQEVNNDPTGDLLRCMIAKFDEYNSAETAKHVSRSMAENARQGFFSGGVPPYGYEAVVVETRGKTSKKKLVPNEPQADVIRRMFDLYQFGDGQSGPLGVKKITEWLNNNGYKTRTGSRWGIGTVHRLITDPIYKGEYWRRTSSGDQKPILIQVSPLVSAESFDEVQRTLKARNYRNTPARLVSTPTLLAGLAVCPICGGGMVVSTGKGGRYRYYVCGLRSRQGAGSCQGIRVRMGETDDLVINAVLKECLNTERLEKMLTELIQRHAAGDERRKYRLSRRQDRLSDVKEGISRLLSMVEKGHMDASDPILAQRLADLKIEHDVAQKEIDSAKTQLMPATEISEQQVNCFSELMRKQLLRGEGPMRQSYLRSVLGRVEVDFSEIRIYGRNGHSKLNAFQARNRRVRGKTLLKPLSVIPRRDRPTVADQMKAR